MRKKPTLISLYSGCGGSALGFKNAGFAITFMNDRNRDACETLEANFPDSLVVRQNIKDVFNFGDADVIEGGFPCQGFSLAGPRKVNDERNSMYHYLKRAIMLVNPKFFVVENVKGFVTIGENGKGQFFNKDGTIKKLGKIATAIVDELASTGTGYNVKYEILNAKDYGLPQDRKRVFVVGVRKDLGFNFKFSSIKKTHGPDISPYVSMAEYGVPEVEDDSEIFQEKKGKRKDYFSARYMSRNRIKKWDNPSFTIPAEAAQVPADPNSQTMWTGMSWWFELCLKEVQDHEWPKFRKNNGNKINPNLRRMSWKQCASIQGFPPAWKFSGDIKSKYRQIGNAVPPPLMQKIAEWIKPYCQEREGSLSTHKEKVTA